MESEADYVLALKRNHRHLSEDVKDAFTGRYTQFTYSTHWIRIMGGWKSGFIQHFDPKKS